MLKTIVIVVVVLLLAVLAYAATRPDTFRVQRSTTIKAAPEKIFALIDDFHRWAAWSPYEQLDPAMQRTFSGADSGKGAVYAWESQGKAGSGRMEITNISTASRVTIQLDFLKPFEGHNIAEFTLQPRDGAIDVTWAMYGPSPYVAKIMGLVFNMDKMIGKDFETGLENMKAVAEK
jgi:Polyketide cyclase / dehydrase and lipid transport